MPKKKVISMLEFLRTGVLGGIACGCTITEVLQRFGKSDYEVTYQGGDISSFRYDSLEIWFNTQTRVVYRITLQRFRNFWKPKSTHSFRQGIPQITRAKVDAWVLRESMDIETVMRFLKTANIKYVQNHWHSDVEELELQSGVCLLFDPNANRSRLCCIYLRDTELTRQIDPSYEKGQSYG
jgi:hypothetical protein